MDTTTAVQRPAARRVSTSRAVNGCPTANRPAGQKMRRQAKKAARRAKRRQAVAKLFVLTVAAGLIILVGASFFKEIEAAVDTAIPEAQNLIAKGEDRLTGKDFNISTVQSPVDYNRNGVDDYTDILNGAKKDAANHPEYDGTYQDDAYPPDHIGVCSDVVWRALKNAGYCLREMVDNDITRRPWAYPEVQGQDWNIDFRRVKNLRVFFDEYAQVLTTDIDAIEEWQPGDIVIFGENRHIGVVSDRRNEQGRTYMLHNGGQPDREEDYLGSKEEAAVAAHYRFDASKIPEDVLVAWHD